MTDLIGYTRTCGAYSSGSLSVYLANAANVTSFTAVSGVYTSVTMVTGKTFKKYDFEIDQCEVKMEGIMENGTYKEVQSIEFLMPEISAAMTIALNEMIDESACGMIAIVELNNVVGAASEKLVIGYNEVTAKSRPLRLISNTGTSGKSLTDVQGQTVVLGCDSPETTYTAVLSIPGA